HAARNQDGGPDLLQRMIRRYCASVDSATPPALPDMLLALTAELKCLACPAYTRPPTPARRGKLGKPSLPWPHRCRSWPGNLNIRLTQICLDNRVQFQEEAGPGATRLRTQIVLEHDRTLPHALRVTAQQGEARAGVGLPARGEFG